MKIEIEYIEDLAGKALRNLPMGDSDIYSEKGVENLEEDDEISLEEGGFMKGYLEE